jgi:hypothetical protein
VTQRPLPKWVLVSGTIVGGIRAAGSTVGDPGLPMYGAPPRSAGGAKASGHGSDQFNRRKGSPDGNQPVSSQGSHHDNRRTQWVNQSKAGTEGVSGPRQCGCASRPQLEKEVAPDAKVGECLIIKERSNSRCRDTMGT